jgi:hypothetical protein
VTISNIVIGPTTCANHIDITATVAGQTRSIQLTREELQLDPGEVRDAFVARLRSFAKENNYTTIVQVRNNLAGKVFEL